MIRRFFLFSLTMLFAFGVLFLSILRTASIKHQFTAPVTQINIQEPEFPEIEYYLPFAGSILPDNVLWPLKALRDWTWVYLIREESKKAEIYLLLADKRLVMTKRLFEKQKYELGVTTLQKAENYLIKSSKMEEVIRTKGGETKFLSELLAQASLKHLEIINKLIKQAPEDARPILIEVKKIPQEVYNSKLNYLNTRGYKIKNNPFDRG